MIIFGDDKCDDNCQKIRYLEDSPQKIRHTSVILVFLACNFCHHFLFKFFNYPDLDMEDSPRILELLN